MFHFLARLLGNPRVAPVAPPAPSTPPVRRSVDRSAVGSVRQRKVARIQASNPVWETDVPRVPRGPRAGEPVSVKNCQFPRHPHASTDKSLREEIYHVDPVVLLGLVSTEGVVYPVLAANYLSTAAQWVNLLSWSQLEFHRLRAEATFGVSFTLKEVARLHVVNRPATELTGWRTLLTAEQIAGKRIREQASGSLREVLPQKFRREPSPTGEFSTGQSPDGNSPVLRPEGTSSQAV